MWMFTWCLAGAAEIPPPMAELLPVRAPLDDTWTGIDRRASRTGRTGGILLGAGFASFTAGLILASYGDDQGSDPAILAGGLLVASGAVSAFAGMPMTLAGSMRAARSLRARGVYVPNAAGIGGWVSFGLSLWVVPAPVTVPMTVVLGLAQMDANRRARERAGLPQVHAGMGDRAAVPPVVLVVTVSGQPPAGRARRTR